MNPNENVYKEFNSLRVIFGVCLAVIFAGAGYLASDFIPEQAKSLFLYIGIGSCILVALLNVISFSAAKANKKQKTVKESNDFFNERRDSALEDITKVIKKLVALRRTLSAYSCFVFILGAGIAFLFGAISTNALHFILSVIAASYPLCAVCFRYNVIPKHDFSQYSKQEDYPIIYSIARRAADALGCKGEIRIVFIPDFNAGIARIGKVYSLQIGSELLSAVTENELYQILLHEFAHVSKEIYPTEKENTLFRKFERAVDTPITIALSLPFAYLNNKFCFEYVIYRMTASIAVEKVADSAILKHGDPQAAANALAKLALSDLFKEESNLLLDEMFFEPEDFRKNLTTKMGREFRRAVEKRGEFWKKLLFNAIQPNSASHPIFRYRVEALGISDYFIEYPEDNSDYRREYIRAADLVDTGVYENEKESYPERRENLYLRPMRDIEKWIKGGRKIVPEEARPIMEALELLNRYEELEALCDDIIENSENVYATAHARKVKGALMLSRYENGGIEHIYKAIEINKNYIEEGLDLIGDYCCKCGIQQELEEYRKKAEEYLQYQHDEYGETGIIRAETDILLKDDMPEEMLEGIKDFIRKADQDQISRVYLIKKQINDNFFTSVVIVRLKPTADRNAVNVVMNKIFNYLDTMPDDRQFSLFLYDKNCADAIEKVGECCIYDSAFDN